MGIVSFNTTTYPCTLHSHSNSPPQAPLKLRPNAPQTIAPFSLPTLRAGLRYVYTLTRSQPTAARAPSREMGTLSSPNIQEGTIVLSVRVGFMDLQQEGEVIDQDSTGILRRSTIRKYVFRARGRGWGVCTSTSGGGGWWKCRGLCGPPQPAGL